MTDTRDGVVPRRRRLHGPGVGGAAGHDAQCPLQPPGCARPGRGSGLQRPGQHAAAARLGGLGRSRRAQRAMRRAGESHAELLQLRQHRRWATGSTAAGHLPGLGQCGADQHPLVELVAERLVRRLRESTWTGLVERQAPAEQYGTSRSTGEQGHCVLLRAEIEREGERLSLVRAQMRAIEAQQHQAVVGGREPQVARLAQLGAIGVGSGWVLVKELFSWRQFRNRREVGGCLGLVPSPYASGESQTEQGISINPRLCRNYRHGQSLETQSKSAKTTAAGVLEPRRSFRTFSNRHNNKTASRTFFPPRLQKVCKA